MSIKRYITERKRSEAIKAIRKTKNKEKVKCIIRDICQCDKSYFDKRLYSTLGLRSKDIMNKGDVGVPLVEKIDACMVRKKFLEMINDINKLAQEGIINIEIKRTKLSIKNK